MSVVGDSIRNGIISEVKSTKYYSIIADEVTNAANHEELSLVFRYVHNEENREVFVEVERITGRMLGEAILNWLEAHYISPADMRGQCYDGASSMSGARSGVKAVVQEAAPKAMYCHCAAYRLNLSVVSACSIQAFKNVESYIGEIARFFNYSAKRQRLLDTSIEACDSTPNAKKLKDACRTRWVERIDSYAVFLLPALHLCLEAIVHPQLHQELGTDWSWDGETITKANGFLFQLQSSLFLVSFQILVQVLHILREPTIKLQLKAIDVVSTYKLVNKVVSRLKSMRTNSVSEFKNQFVEAARIAKKLHGDHFELQTPRISGWKRHRSNPPSSTAEEYYRITLYDEFLSHVVSELGERFVNNPSHSITIGLLHLLPRECIKLGDDVLVPEDPAKAVNLFKGDLPHAVIFNTEYRSWVWEWKEYSSAAVPDTLIGALKECSVLAYPNLNALLILALTLPITSCESERSFSQLKLVKTARRATMSESWLNSLALMKIDLERCNERLSKQNMKELNSIRIHLAAGCSSCNNCLHKYAS